MRSNQIKKDILYRLVLAKTFFSNATNIITDPTINQYSLAQGLLCLHDALDNFLGATVSKLVIKVKPRKDYSLLETLDLITKFQGTTLDKTTEIKQLNAIRNNIKHQGIPPNVSFGTALLQPIKDFFIKYCQDFFYLSWDTISLADLIKEIPVKKEMKDIEEMILKNQFKEALDGMAILKFKVFDYSDLLHYLNDKRDLSPPSEKVKKAREKKYVFQSDFKGEWFSDIYEKIDSIEQGIDRNKMSQFESLTAKCGIKNDSTKKIISKHGSSWGQPNWTKLNALFCFSFLIDIILKTQQKEKEYLEIMIYQLYTIRIKNFDVHIYKLSSEDKIDKELYKLLKNNEYKALIFNYKNGNWENFSEFILISLQDSSKIVGYIKNEDKRNIVITNTREVEIPVR